MPMVVVAVVVVSASSMDPEVSAGEPRPVPSRHRIMIEVIFIFMMLSGARVAECKLHQCLSLFILFLDPLVDIFMSFFPNVMQCA